nr:MAG TPA: hypothetical protein [Caudoviricetes sp.]
MKYVADNGKIFATQEECLEYEKVHGAKMLYKEEFINTPLPCAVENVRKSFDDFYRDHVLSDDYLKEIDREARYETNMVEERKYGIVYLRDDGVNILLRYIDMLEEEISRFNCGRG